MREDLLGKKKSKEEGHVLDFITPPSSHARVANGSGLGRNHVVFGSEIGVGRNLIVDFGFDFDFTIRVRFWFRLMRKDSQRHEDDGVRRR